MRKYKDASQKKRGKGKRAGRIVATVLLSLLLLVSGSVLGLSLYLNRTVDLAADASLFEAAKGSHTTRFYFNAERGGNVYLAREWESERLHGGENSIWCPLSEMPPSLPAAFLAVEDHRYFEHEGVDWLRTAKALFNYLFHFDSRFGGSTVTQQLIKNISGESDPSPLRKLREMYRAIALEQKYSKKEILELYLNIVPMGENCAGVAAGAERYFGKRVRELSVAEAATLAAIINAPTRYDPLIHPENNAIRRRLVLSRMREHGFLDEAGYQAAMAQTLTLRTDPPPSLGAVRSWYTETVIDDVIADLVEKKGYSLSAARHLLYNGGLQIYTLVDPRVQSALEEVFTASPPPANTQYAGVILDPANGDLLGIVGAAGKKEGNRLLNFATTPHAPGSALKPLSVYAPAMDAGLISWSSVFDDVPVSFSKTTGAAWPKNSPSEYMGLCDVATALTVSKNTVAVRVLELLGQERAYATLTRSLKMTTLTRGSTGKSGEKLTDLAPAPLALGQLTHGVSVRELTGGYTPLCGDGCYRKSRSYLAVYDGKGNVLLTNEQEFERVWSKTTASIMTMLLKNVVENGTAAGVSLPRGIPVAGKTGTSNGNHDKWFVGYTPYYLGGIWCGATDGKTALLGRPQLTLYNAVMSRIHQAIPDAEATRQFVPSAGVYACRYCRDGGGLYGEACLCDPRGNRSAVGWFTADSLPRAVCDRHVRVIYDTLAQGVVGECEDGGIGSEGLPEGYSRVGLIRVEDRLFPRQVTVKDAQYVYRPFGEGPLALGADAPYFLYSVPKGMYVGISDTLGGRQFNAGVMHRPAPLFPEETQAPQAVSACLSAKPSRFFKKNRERVEMRLGMW